MPGIAPGEEGTSGDGATSLDSRKGILVKIEEDENIPVDAAGNRAEIISDPVATLNRMNLARLHEHYHSGAARDISVEVRKMVGLGTNVLMEQLECVDQSIIMQAHQYILSYYNLVSERQYEFFKALPYEKCVEHVYNVLKKGIYPYFPVENQKDPIKMVKDVQAAFKPVYGPVRYIGNSGKVSVTKEKVRIAPMYIMMLDKTAMEWSATSTAKLQHFGVLTPLTKSEKFSRPYRNSPTRTVGETEGRIYASYGGPRLVAELFDRSNNPSVQKNIAYTLLTEQNPGNIDQLVDREQYPYGQSRSLINVMEIMHCSGFTITYVPEGTGDNA